MIPRIKSGNSFKGAALYYLHDKRREGEAERLTTERVEWTHAFNTLEEAPEQVIAEMQHTAMRQQALKLLSGNRLDGRPTERTVMTVALAWSPEQSPTREQMIEASQSYLTRMGWQEHQVLLVAHNDTKHPHVHLIINRIHPETGMTLDDSWAKTRSQRWALAYEREQGRIFCHAREAKYGRSSDRNAEHMNYREWRQWQEMMSENACELEYRQALQAGEWALLKEGQKQERIGFWSETGRMRKELRASLRGEVRQEFAPDWRAYAVHRAEREEQAKLYDREARRALRHYRRHGPLHGIEAVKEIKERQQAYHAGLRDDLTRMRMEISGRQKARLEELATPALARLGKDREATYKDVLARQREDRAVLRHDQAEGVRRYDMLREAGSSSPPTPGLTPEQQTAYVAHALKTSAREQERDRAGREGTQADRGSVEPSRDPREAKAAREQADRALEKHDKDQAQEAKRQTSIDWYIEKRKADRARERDGGRDR